MINLKTHGAMDYAIALMIILSPYLFGFSDVTEARNVFVSLGIGLAAYSLISRYYYSAAKIIPLGAHMLLDVLTGIALMLAPTVFDYDDAISSPQLALHFILGLSSIGLVALTRPKSESEILPHSRFSRQKLRS